jgi:DNA polymerase III delta prime subunit
MDAERKRLLLERLREVARAEKIKATDETLTAILEAAQWSMRGALARLDEIEGRKLASPPLNAWETALSRAADVVQAALNALMEAAERGASRSELARLSVEYLARTKAFAAETERNINHEAKELVAKLLGESRGK